MTSICAGKIGLCHVMMQAETTPHTGVVFHGLPPFLQKGVETSNCSLGTFNPVKSTIFKPWDWEQGHKIGIMINGKDLDPRTLLHLTLVTVTHESSYQVFHSFYEEMQSEFPISVKTKNFLLSLAESISQTLNVTLCYVCGGTNTG
jgi:hypothetical protein